MVSLMQRLQSLTSHMGVYLCCRQVRVAQQHLHHTQVRAAREQGWDQATLWIDSYQGGPNGRTTSARSANPYRPAQELPTEDGAVIVPAEDFEFIWAGYGRYFARLTYSAQLRRWYGVAFNGGPAWAAFWYGDPETITPGTWRAV